MRAALAAAVLLAACATRVTGGVYDDDGGGEAPLDATVVPDLAAPPVDLAPPADLAQKNCGQIMTCVIGCGLTPGACQLGCFQGASPKATQEAGALLACAVQKCLLADGGNLPLCMISNCGNQIQMCEGFGFGG